MSTREVTHTIAMNYIRSQLPSFCPALSPTSPRIFLRISTVWIREQSARLSPIKREPSSLLDTRIAEAAEWLNRSCWRGNKWRKRYKEAPISLLVSPDTWGHFPFWASDFWFRSREISLLLSNTQPAETWWLSRRWRRWHWCRSWRTDSAAFAKFIRPVGRVACPFQTGCTCRRKGKTSS